MRSKARLKSHPIHPMIIPFPLAFLMGGFVFDVAGWALERPALWQTGAHLVLAGMIMAVVAAVPGFIDYLYTVPPQSTGKQRATRHMLLNLSAVAAFAVAWLLRGHAAAMPDGAQLALETLGTVLLTMGGWMGGTLAFRNQIGVDHRYARAGKWQEEKIEPRRGEPVRVADADDLEVNQMKLLRIGDRRIVLARTEDGYAAFDDRCTHRGGSLAGGTLICGTVQCPWHGSQFDVKTGAVKSGPAKQEIGTYQVQQQGEAIRLVL